MKFPLALATLITAVQACIRIHVNQGNIPFQDDGMRIQLWDNNDFYETQRQSKGSASADDHWYFSLGNGKYNVDLWNNGKEGSVTLPSGYKGWFYNRLQQCEENCYVWGENYCKASGFLYEYAADDNFGNCHEFGHQLCNFAECKGWHEQGWSDSTDPKCYSTYT